MMGDENTISSSSARIKRKLIIQKKRMNATCKNQKHVKNKTRDCTPLVDVTTYFVNQHTLHMESQLQCSESRFRNVERNITTTRKKLQSLLEKFETSVNNVTNVIHCNIPTQSFQLEHVEEQQSDSDKSESFDEPIEGNSILCNQINTHFIYQKIQYF